MTENNTNEFDMYLSGMSIPEISEKTSIPLSTLRFRFKKAGILRSRKDGIVNAVARGRLKGRKGIKRVFTEEWKRNIAKARLIAGKKQSAGIEVSKGYPRFTRGKYKGLFVHIYIMEMWLGRKLQNNECVHHIDGDKTNNNINNLALVTKSGHSRLHRHEDALGGKILKRNSKGQFLKAKQDGK